MMNNEITKCEFYLSNKKRTCRMGKANGEKFCHTHLQTIRIPCPYDNRHTIYEKDLKKHVKKCPLYLIQKEQQNQPYYMPNINQQIQIEEEIEISTELIPIIIEKIYNLFSTNEKLSSILFQYFNSKKTNEICEISINSPNISKENSSHSLSHLNHENNEKNNEESKNHDQNSLSLKTYKHEHQIDQMIKLIDEKIAKNHQENKKKIVIEFGAGKAQLSSRFHKFHPNFAHLLIDYKKNFKNKHERKEEDKNDAFFRIHIDIKHIHLEKSLFHLFGDENSSKFQNQEINNENNLQNDRKEQVKGEVEKEEGGEGGEGGGEGYGNEVYSIAKHLCGSALDMSIINTLNNSNKYKSKYIMFASCCHHRCNWSSFCNRDYFEQLNFDRCSFPILCKLSSWATSIEIEDYERCGVIENKEEKIEINSLENWQKVQIGRMCKLLIDQARMEFLNSHLYSCSIYRFIDQLITKENCLLFAERN